MTVLSTRILTTAQRGRLEANGLNLIEDTFIDIAYESKAGFVRFVAANPNIPFVFTSQNGFKAFIENIGDREIEYCKMAYCMQGATQNLLLEKGWQILGVAGNSLELANLIISEHKGELIYITGNLRSDGLSNSVEKAGIGMYEWILYETKPTPKQIDALFDAVIFFSPSGVNSFFSSNTVTANTKVFCIGDVTAKAAHNAGAVNVLVAVKPDVDCLIDLVIAES